MSSAQRIGVEEAEASFEDFVRQNVRHMIGLARRLLATDRAEAHDVVQDALSIAWKHWPRIAAMENPRAYLRAIVVRQCHRRWRRWLPIPMPANFEPAPLDDHSSRHAEADAMMRILKQLSRRRRQIIVLSFYEDLDDKRIGELLHISPSTVRQHRMNAVAQLEALLQAEEQQP